MPHAIQPTWDDFHRRLREIATAERSQKVARKHYWRVLRTHPWLGIELGDLATRRNEHFLPREEVPFLLAASLARLSTAGIQALTQQAFRARILDCWALATRQFAQAASVRVSSANEHKRAQRAVDQCRPRVRCVLTLRLKGHSLVSTARLLKLSAWETYSVWRDGALQIANILTEPKPSESRKLP